jgi:hypothetical protein
MFVNAHAGMSELPDGLDHSKGHAQLLAQVE